MTTVVIDDKKKGAPEMLELLRALDFVAFFEAAPKNNTLRMRRQGLIKYPAKYDPMALAGAAEDSPLDLAQIRIGWTKRK
jgi:hypothetical protein